MVWGRPETSQIRHFKGLPKSVPPAYKVPCGNRFFGGSWPPPNVAPARNQEEGLKGTKRRKNTCGCTFWGSENRVWGRPGGYKTTLKHMRMYLLGVWNHGFGRPETFQIRHFKGLPKSVPPSVQNKGRKSIFLWIVGPPPYVVPARYQEEGLEGTKTRKNTCGCTFWGSETIAFER